VLNNVKRLNLPLTRSLSERAGCAKSMARVVRKYAVAHVSGQLLSGRVMQSLTSLARQVVEGTVTLLDSVYFDNMDAAVDAMEKD
jgi:hypothetical protein